MDEQEMLRRLGAIGAIITGSHIVYTSGRHGSAYVNKDAIYQHPHLTRDLCAALVAPYDPDVVEVVAGPAVGGVVLAQWSAWHLTERRTSGETLAVYAEEEAIDGKKRLTFRRGYDDAVRGRRVLVVEDIVNTGGSVRLLIDAVRELGAEIVGASVLCVRGAVGDDALGGVPLRALLAVPLDAWPAEECPLCRQSVPINTKVGKGQAFLAQRERQR